MILDFGGGFFLRHATAADHPDLCRVCLLTGDAGTDASAREDEPDLMGQVYAVPYQVLEPDLAFVVDSPEGVAGYLFGALDSPAFNARLARDWYPRLRRRVADPGPDSGRWQGSDWVRHMIHRFDPAVPAPLQAFPSHGHIDLLAPARGRGIGRRAIGHLERCLAERGSSGLFLDVHPQNRGAQAFYAKLGYAPVEIPGATSFFMAKQLPAQSRP